LALLDLKKLVDSPAEKIRVAERETVVLQLSVGDPLTTLHHAKPFTLVFAVCSVGLLAVSQDFRNL